MRRLVALIATGTLALSIAGVAGAQGTFFNTSLTINFSRSGNDSFFGRVKSPKPRCIRQRKVSVYRKRSGTDQKIGSDLSSSTGRWRINVGGSAHRGDYYAKTKALTIPAGVCKGARSVTTHVS